MKHREKTTSKTTVARAIQEEGDEPYLYWGVDTLFSMVPEKWVGARGGHLSFEGFRYDRSEHDEGGRRLVSIRYGDVGRRMLAAACASVAKLALKDCNVVVDEMLLDPGLLEDTRERRTLQERLEGARSNLRFADKRIAALEAELLERPKD
ncbi:hypothetical protein ACFCV8_20480 [Streptomyces sp. NPDC056347]|uniref:phosphotransferase-like protein n=1 Tax=Streptomyces sp. NPDC056347 TaxID=3345790 RepID=UPI0035DDFD21